MIAPLAPVETGAAENPPARRLCIQRSAELRQKPRARLGDLAGKLDDGQRIQKYSIDIWTGAAWKTVVAAQAIGHKKIDAFPSVTAARVRLNILSSTDAAAIREFQLYNVEDTVEQK